MYLSFFFFFNDTATTEIYTLSLHDALPISIVSAGANDDRLARPDGDGRAFFLDQALGPFAAGEWAKDRKSTRLNSSHVRISYAVFCLKKKKKRWATFEC